MFKRPTLCQMSLCTEKDDFGDDSLPQTQDMEQSATSPYSAGVKHSAL